MIRVFARADKVLASWEVQTDDTQEAINVVEEVRQSEKIIGAIMAVAK